MLEVRNIHAGYGALSVLRGIDMQIAEGEVVAVLGSNGVGKTTLNNVLCGLVPHTQGDVTFLGESLQGVDANAVVSRGLIQVPEGRLIFPNLTVLENIETGMEQSLLKTVPDEIYELFPVLHDMRSRKGGNLSGGQQQQLAIARALVSNPKVLLLDEPTEGIQPSIIKDIARALNRIRETRKISIVVSEQVLSFALDVADRLFVIEGGRLVHESPRASTDTAHIRKMLSV